MNNFLLIAFVTLFLIGCQTTKPADVIRQDYKTVVFDDGISLEEAIFIAKKTVLDRTPPESYLIDEPSVVTNFENVPHHEDYWFISFREMQGGRIPIVFLVAIHKESGKIVFSRSYNPENEWVVQAVFLKLYEKPQ